MQIAKRLAETSVPMYRVANASGVARSAIIAIRDGITTNPGILTVERINRALDELENTDTCEPAGGPVLGPAQSPAPGRGATGDGCNGREAGSAGGASGSAAGGSSIHEKRGGLA